MPAQVVPFNTSPPAGVTDRDLLWAIFQQLGGSAGSAPPSGGLPIGGTQRTPAITTATGDGTVAAGKKYVSFIFSTDFAGTVLGATFAGPADSFVDFTAPVGDTLGAIAYTISAGNARIQTIT